jgi:hypothetical protein
VTHSGLAVTTKSTSSLALACLYLGAAAAKTSLPPDWLVRLGADGADVHRLVAAFVECRQQLKIYRRLHGPKRLVSEFYIVSDDERLKAYGDVFSYNGGVDFFRFDDNIVRRALADGDGAMAAAASGEGGLEKPRVAVFHVRKLAKFKEL